MRYNHLFANHFGSCRLLKVGHDPHRNRDVKIYAVPGEFDVVGISDGTDCWVAPINTGFLEDVRKMLERIRAGEDVKPLGLGGTTPTGRRRINFTPELHQLPVSETAKRIRRVIHLPS